jgi:hypothetical protein
MLTGLFYYGLTLDYCMIYSKSSSSLHPFITYFDADYVQTPGKAQVVLHDDNEQWSSELEKQAAIHCLPFHY